jgi:ABC-type branched-subunit amino acid transport system ATPase component
MLIIDDFTLRAGLETILHVPLIHIQSGEKALLHADNSKGKSLLLKAIKDHYRDYNGSIQLREPEGSKHKNNTCILLELAPHLLKDHTVWQNLVLPFKKISDLQERKLLHYLKFASLEQIQEKKVNQCSFAEMKMIEMVRAMLIEPYLLLIDDLDKFFDLEHYQLVFQMIEHLNASGCSVFATSSREIPGFTIHYLIQDRELIKC